MIKTSNRMDHGLSSSARAEERSYHVAELGRLLARPAPECLLVQRVALDLADAILHLEEVSKATTSITSEYAGPDPDRIGWPMDTSHHSIMRHIKKAFSAHATRMRRIFSYERKARSRRDGLIRRLDHLILEARRREDAEQARIKALCGKFGPFD